MIYARVTMTNKSSVIRQKVESQNECFKKKTKHAKFSEKLTFLTPWYAHVCVRIRGKKYLFFGKFWRALFFWNTRHVRDQLQFFSIRVYFNRHWQFPGQQGKGMDHLLFHSTTSTRSRTFRHLFSTLHMRWLSRIFNFINCIYQIATR